LHAQNIGHSQRDAQREKTFSGNFFLTMNTDATSAKLESTAPSSKVLGRKHNVSVPMRNDA
jgi:hypothetical protein